MIFFLKLVLAHLIADFILQPSSWVVDKECFKVRSLKLYLHLLIHGALVLVLLWDFSYWPLALSIAITHGLIDTLKLYGQKTSSKGIWFFIDQTLHLASILFLASVFIEAIPEIRSFPIEESFWVYLTAIIFITFVSGICIQVLLKDWSSSIDQSHDESLINAGKYIGILERLFVFTFVVSGYWEGIGFLLAAKSIFRFGDLKESKDRKLTEYILIGTLLSFAIATASGMLVLAVVS